MLRTAVLLLGGLSLIASLLCAMQGAANAALFLFVNGLVLTLAIVYERWRYRSIVTRPEPGWQATGERFVDPETERLTEVYYDPATGSRHYVDARNTH